jgi:RHS repeat-associated protein
MCVITFVFMASFAQAKNTLLIVVNDHLGTPQMLVDKNNHVVWQAEYDEFGKAEILIEEVEFNMRLPGQYYDKESGLHYNYYRDYDPSLGRYVQSDPIGLRGGINTYAYVGGNPLSYVDPLGLDAVIALNGPIPSNPFGHTGQGFTGRGVFSYGTAHADGSSFSQYVLDQASKRDSTYYVFETTPEEDQAMIDKYNAFKGLRPYDKIEHNCSTATSEVVQSGNLGGFDMWGEYLFESNRVAPNTIAVMLHRYAKSGGNIREVFVPKGSTDVPFPLKQFDPH